MAESGSVVQKVFGTKRELAEAPVSESVQIGRNATTAFSGLRILFGAVFLFDGLLKWVLFQQGTMQGVVQGFGYDYLSNNWVLVGVLVGLGETLAGAALMVGLFQRPAAIASAGIMMAIFGFGGWGGIYSPDAGWSFVGYTDPGGDLMLVFVFVMLVFSPYAYSIASRYHLRDRFPGSSIGAKLARFLVT